MKTQKVITYQSTSGATVDLTPEQSEWMDKHHTTLHDAKGNEYAQVKIGLHDGHPSRTNEQIAQLGLTKKQRVAMSLAAHLLGLPSGAWPETQQAIRQLREETLACWSEAAAIAAAKFAGCKIHPSRLS